MRPQPTRPRRPGRRPPPAALGLGLALALVLAACGGSPDGDGVATLGGAAKNDGNGTPNASAARDPQEAALEFARCMRRHGIDMPDPEVDEQGRVTMRIGPGPGGQGGSRPDPRKLDAAQKACGDPMGGDGPAQIDPKARDALVAYARCMRGQGVDMPDPTGDSLVMRRGEGPDPESPEFKAADKACNHHLANLGPPAQRSGGGS